MNALLYSYKEGYEFYIQSNNIKNAIFKWILDKRLTVYHVSRQSPEKKSNIGP